MAPYVGLRRLPLPALTAVYAGSGMFGLVVAFVGLIVVAEPHVH